MGIENKLPEGWREELFIDISKFIDYRGKTPKKTESGVPLITAKNVRMGILNEAPREFIAEEEFDNWMTRGFPKKGDVLFTTEAPLGNVALLDSNEKRAFAQRLITFSPKGKDYISPYLFYYLLSPIFQYELHGKSTGTTVKGIKSSILKKFLIPLPLLPEQKRIVQKLDALFERIDQAIALLEESIAATKELMDAVLGEVFEEASEKWKTYKLEDFDKISAGGTPSRSEKKYWVGGTVPWFISRELNTHTVDFAKEKITELGLKNSSAKLFSKGTLLVGMYDTAAMKMSILKIDAACNQAIVGIKPDAKLLDIEFLKFQLEFLRPRILEQRQGVRQQNLNATKIRNVEIAVPSKKVQNSIVFFIKNIMEKQSQLYTSQQQKLQSLHDLKTSLLDQAFKGAL